MTAISSRKDNHQQVVLLHGLGRRPSSLNKLARYLKQNNFRVLNLGYPSITGDFDKMLEATLPKIQTWQNPHLPLHFVGHSFGGILTRGLLSRDPGLKRGRVVMLGSPNQGTRTANFMLQHRFLKHFVPKVTRRITERSDWIQSLPEPDTELGIIAGNVAFHPLIPVSWYYRKATEGAAGDGVVEISNTQCRKMADFLVLPLHHSFMMWDSELIRQVENFLNKGSFLRSPEQKESPDGTRSD